MDDYDLMQGVKAGDESAFSLLYERYADKLKRIAMRDIYTIRDAEDIVQEFFIYIWNHAKNYSPDRGTPFAWMYIILRRRVLDRIRQKRAYTRRMALWSNACEQYSTGTQEEIERNDISALMLQAIGTLPKAQQACILMTYVDGMSTREIGRAVNLHYGTVRTRINLGKQKIKFFLLNKGADLCSAYAHSHRNFNKVCTENHRQKL